MRLLCDERVFIFTWQKVDYAVYLFEVVYRHNECLSFYKKGDIAKTIIDINCFLLYIYYKDTKTTVKTFLNCTLFMLTYSISSSAIEFKESCIRLTRNFFLKDFS